jgi:hypothetical protein
VSVYNILVPAGIGDFSWIWSKLSTTSDAYHVEYAKCTPDRLGPFLELLPKNKLLSYQASNYRCFFNSTKLDMQFSPASSPKILEYNHLRLDRVNHVEPNTHLEQGGRIETWLPDLPETDFHYKIEGLLQEPERENVFLVHLYSTHTFKIWKHYDIDTWISIIHMIQTYSGLMPVFIGAEYDDFALLVHDMYTTRYPNLRVVNKINRTKDLLSALHLVQQCKFFLGAVSSGMTMLANVLKVPSASWWPREALATSWNAPDVLYLWMLWKDPEDDKRRLKEFIDKL